MAVKKHPFSDELVHVEKGLVIRDSEEVQVGKLEGIIMDREQQKAIYIILNPNREKISGWFQSPWLPQRRRRE